MSDEWYEHVVSKADELDAEDAVGWLTAAIAETGGTHAKTADLAWRLGLAHRDAATGHARHFLNLASEMATGPFKDIVLLDLFIEGLCAGEVDDDAWDAIDNPWLVGEATPLGPGHTARWPRLREGARSTALDTFMSGLRPAVRAQGLLSGAAWLAGYRGLAWLIEAEHDAERHVEDWLHGCVRVRIETADPLLVATIQDVSGKLADPAPFHDAVRALWVDGKPPV